MPEAAPMSPKSETKYEYELDVPHRAKVKETPVPATTQKQSPENQHKQQEQEQQQQQGKPSKAQVTKLLDSVLPAQYNQSQDNQNEQHPYARATKETILSVLNALKTTILAHLYISTFLLFQLLLSGLPITLFLIGLVITTTIAAGVFTFCALLVLTPVLAVTGFLGICLWGWFWAVWTVAGIVWRWYSGDNKDEDDVLLPSTTAGKVGKNSISGGNGRGSSWVSVPQDSGGYTGEKQRI